MLEDVSNQYSELEKASNDLQALLDEQEKTINAKDKYIVELLEELTELKEKHG